MSMMVKLLQISIIYRGSELDLKRFKISQKIKTLHLSCSVAMAIKIRMILGEAKYFDEKLYF